MPFHHSPVSRRLAIQMIHNAIIPLPIGTNFFTSQTHANLFQARSIKVSVQRQLPIQCQPLSEGGDRITSIGFATAPLASFHQARGQMNYPATVLAFIAKLTTRACTTKPLNAQIACSKLQGIGVTSCFAKYRNSYTAGMYAATFFGWGSALYAMSAGFLEKILRLLAGNA